MLIKGLLLIEDSIIVRTDMTPSPPVAIIAGSGGGIPYDDTQVKADIAVNATAITNIVNGTTKVGDSEALDGHDSTYFATADEVSGKEDALPATPHDPSNKVLSGNRIWVPMPTGGGAGGPLVGFYATNTQHNSPDLTVGAWANLPSNAIDNLLWESHPGGFDINDQAYTIPESGIYEIKALMSVREAFSDGYLFVAIAKNAEPRYTAALGRLPMMAGQWGGVEGSCQIRLNTGDVIRIRFYIAGNRRLATTQATYLNFGARKLAA